MKKKQSSKRQRAFWLVVWSFMIASLLVFIINLPIWKIQTIEVEGTTILNADQIRVFSEIPFGENIFLINLKKARREIANLPQVKTSKVIKILPGKIVIKITERTPFAIVSCSGRTMLIDANGYNLSFTGPDNNLLLDLPDTSKMPIVSGLRTEYFENQIKLKAEYLMSVQESIQRLSIDFPYHSLHLSFDQEKNLSLLIDDSLMVKLGESKELSRKMALFRVIYKDLIAKNKIIGYIDLKYPDNPVVRIN